LNKFFICYSYYLVAMSNSALFLALVSVIVPSLGTNRIIGGEDATHAPWIVSLIWSSTGSVYWNFACAGSIINESWVLTAAHCAVGLDASDFYIIAGALDLSDTSGGQSRNIKKIYMHNNYDDWTLENDIALLKLQSPLELNDDVAVIELANEGDPEEIGQEYTIEGWGSMDPIEYKPAYVLQVLEGVPHYKMTKCKKELQYDIWRRKNICAGGNVGYDGCYGDSGGPMWMMVESTRLLYGITSWGEGCASELPAVYTKVSYYRRWIERKMGHSLSNPCTCTASDSCDCY